MRSTGSPSLPSRWSQWLEHAQRDLRLWLLLVTALSCFRLAFILAFHAQIAEGTGVLTVLAASLNGVRYDMMVAGYLVLPSILVGILAAITLRTAAADRVRRICTRVAIPLLAISCAGFVGYFREYGEPFDSRIFGLLFDDTRAIGVTIWKDYRPVETLVATFAVIWLAVRLADRVIGAPTAVASWLARRSRGLATRTLISVMVVVVCLGALRGSLGRRPAQLKDAAVTGDLFLDKAVLNPLTSLRYAIVQELEMRGASGLNAFLPDRDIRGAAARLLGTRAADEDLDAYLRHTAPGSAHVPRHIFLIVGEGLSAWPMYPDYVSLGLANGIRELAREGLALPWFLPSSYGTAETLSVLMTGLAEAEVHTNYQARSRSPYPSSLAPAFAKLGYRTRFFYGGYLSWQRIGDFARDQGFEEVYGGSSMGSWVRSNEWGVDDEFLFDFILSHTDDQVPTFDLIMTTSLHPPYDIDTRSKGFVPPDAAALATAPTNDVEFMGHYWYADKYISEFVRAANSRLPSALFAITGDHPSRIGSDRSGNLLTSRTVPLILFGPSVLDSIEMPKETRGSHMDIGPTLIELSAPAGFTYHALGSSVLRTDGHPLGIGQHTVLGQTQILDLRHQVRLQPLPEGAAAQVSPGSDEVVHAAPRAASSGPESESDLGSELEAATQWRALHDAAHAVAWWRIVNGPDLPTAQ